MKREHHLLNLKITIQYTLVLIYIPTSLQKQKEQEILISYSPLISYSVRLLTKPPFFFSFVRMPYPNPGITRPFLVLNLGLSQDFDI